MPETFEFPLTHQGVRVLNQPTHRVPQRGSQRVNVGETERALSSLGGAVLAGLGAGRGGSLGLALAAVGASMIYRGSSGHCSLYAAAGIDTAHG